MCTELLREWKWPEGFVIPPAVLDDPRKMKLIKKVQSDIDKHIKRTRKDFHGMAATGNFQLDNRMILRYLEGTIHINTYVVAFHRSHFKLFVI